MGASTFLKSQIVTPLQDQAVQSLLILVSLTEVLDLLTSLLEEVLQLVIPRAEDGDT